MKKYVVYNTFTQTVCSNVYNQNQDIQLHNNEIKVEITQQQEKALNQLNQDELFRPLLKLFTSYNKTQNKLIFFKIITDWKYVIDNKQSNKVSILTKVKNQLWLNTEHFYQGRHQYHTENNLARSQIDAYQLGMFNYQRQKQGKSIVGQIIISPDNKYMLANLQWGQNIWSLYYKKCKEIQQAFKNGEQIINCQIGYKEALGEKPYSLSQILQWQKEHQEE